MLRKHFKVTVCYAYMRLTAQSAIEFITTYGLAILIDPATGLVTNTIEVTWSANASGIFLLCGMLFYLSACDDQKGRTRWTPIVPHGNRGTGQEKC